jgi:hypothetical protein
LSHWLGINQFGVIQVKPRCPAKGHAGKLHYFVFMPASSAEVKAPFILRFAPIYQYFGNSKINLLSAILALKPAPGF